MQPRDVPYYPSPSNSHCAQATMRMGYEYFNPQKVWTWEELDELSGHRDGITTWNMRFYIETAKMGYDTVIYDPIDYQKLAEDFEGYINENFSPAYAEETLRMSDKEQAITDSKILLDHKDDLKLHNRSYTIKEYKDLLDKGYVIATWVNHAIYCDSVNEFWPHFILVYDYSEEGVIAHDPGGIEEPQFQIPNLLIKWDVFKKSIQMNEKGEKGEILAFRKNKEKEIT